MNKITDGSASFIVRKIGGGWTTNQRYHHGIQWYV
nr:MAG TPA: hypothetical protein [Caudoviricetes sp.]